MPSEVNLGKVKLVYTGDYSDTRTYYEGDIVRYVSLDGNATDQLFIYKNAGTAKSGSYPYSQVITGVAQTIGINTDRVRLTLGSYNPGGQFDRWVTPNVTR